MLFEFFPIILFFIAFKFKGIYFATGIAIVASVLQITIAYLRTRKVENMMWISLVIITVFGGSTLLLRNELFIKWKPTVLYWVFAAVIAGARVFFKKNIIKAMLGKKIEMPEGVWSGLNTAWGCFFAALGVLNLFVAYSYSTAAWVNFKLFGIMGLMFVFVIIQSFFLAPHVKEGLKND